jgi:hypothetical protein
VLAFLDKILAVSMVLCAVNIDDAIEMMAVYYKCYLDQVACVLVHRNLIVDIGLVVMVVAYNWMVIENRMEDDALFRLQSNSLYPNYRNQLFLYICMHNLSFFWFGCMLCAKYFFL